jgi:hypothetical protein
VEGQTNGQRGGFGILKLLTEDRHRSLEAGAPDGRPRSRYMRHVTEISWGSRWEASTGRIAGKDLNLNDLPNSAIHVLSFSGDDGEGRETEFPSQSSVQLRLTCLDVLAGYVVDAPTVLVTVARPQPGWALLPPLSRRV